MDYKIPEPIGDFEWENLVVDLLARNNDLESLKLTINQAIKERLYLDYLWYLNYKDSPEDYLIYHDVGVEFYKSLFDDPTSNQPSVLYLEHLLQHAFIGSEKPKYKTPQVPDYYESPFEERNGRLYLKVKVDPPYPFKPIEPVLNELRLPEKKYFTTRDLCCLLDLHPDTFRYRLRVGIYPESKIRAGDKRRFTLDEVREIVQITEGMLK